MIAKTDSRQTQDGKTLLENAPKKQNKMTPLIVNAFLFCFGFAYPVEAFEVAAFHLLQIAVVKVGSELAEVITILQRVRA